MPKVEFTHTVIYETEGYKKGPKFEEGEVYDLSDEQAERWVRRNVAKIVKEKKAKEDKASKDDESEVAEEEPADSDNEDEEEEGEETEETEGVTQPTMPRRRGRPPKAR